MATIITAVPLQPRRYYVAFWFTVATRLCVCVHDVFSLWSSLQPGELNEWEKKAGWHMYTYKVHVVVVCPPEG